MRYAGFWARVIAYLVDILPIVVAIGTIHYFFLGFDEVLHRYLEHRDDLAARIDFLKQRNVIRDTSLLVWLLYSFIGDASPLQGTLGKRLIGIRVTDTQGNRLTVANALLRNAVKPVSFIPFGIGALWAAFTSKKQTWHDLAAKALVIRT